MSSVPFAQIKDLMVQLGIVKVELVGDEKGSVIGIQTTDVNDRVLQFNTVIINEGKQPDDKPEQLEEKQDDKT